MQFALGGERLEVSVAHPAHPRRTPIAAARTVAAIGRWPVTVVGRRRGQIHLTGDVRGRWKIVGGIKINNVRFAGTTVAPLKIAVARRAVRQVTVGRQNDGGIVGHAFGTDARAFDGQNENDIVIRPMLGLADVFVREQIGVADGHNGVAVGVE